MRKEVNREKKRPEQIVSNPFKYFGGEK